MKAGRAEAGGTGDAGSQSSPKRKNTAALVRVKLDAVGQGWFMAIEAAFGAARAA